MHPDIALRGNRDCATGRRKCIQKEGTILGCFPHPVSICSVRLLSRLLPLFQILSFCPLLNASLFFAPPSPIPFPLHHADPSLRCQLTPLPFPVFPIARLLTIPALTPAFCVALLSLLCFYIFRFLLLPTPAFTAFTNRMPKRGLLFIVGCFSSFVAILHLLTCSLQVRYCRHAEPRNRQSRAAAHMHVPRIVCMLQQLYYFSNKT